MTFDSPPFLNQIISDPTFDDICGETSGDNWNKEEYGVLDNPRVAQLRDGFEIGRAFKDWAYNRKPQYYPPLKVHCEQFPDAGSQEYTTSDSICVVSPQPATFLGHDLSTELPCTKVACANIIPSRPTLKRFDTAFGQNPDPDLPLRNEDTSNSAYKGHEVAEEMDTKGYGSMETTGNVIDSKSNILEGNGFKNVVESFEVIESDRDCGKAGAYGGRGALEKAAGTLEQEPESEDPFGIQHLKSTGIYSHFDKDDLHLRISKEMTANKDTIGQSVAPEPENERGFNTDTLLTWVEEMTQRLNHPFDTTFLSDEYELAKIGILVSVEEEMGIGGWDGIGPGVRKCNDSACFIPSGLRRSWSFME